MKCTGGLIIRHSDSETFYPPLEIIYYALEHLILAQSTTFNYCYPISTISSV